MVYESLFHHGIINDTDVNNFIYHLNIKSPIGCSAVVRSYVFVKLKSFNFMGVLRFFLFLNKCRKSIYNGSSY